MMAVIEVLIFCVAFAVLLWAGLRVDAGKCPDCGHAIELHGHHCEEDGCCCESSQAELRAGAR